LPTKTLWGVNLESLNSCILFPPVFFLFYAKKAKKIARFMRAKILEVQRNPLLGALLGSNCKSYVNLDFGTAFTKDLQCGKRFPGKVFHVKPARMALRFRDGTSFIRTSAYEIISLPNWHGKLFNASG
jgi:hypothetical protein